MIVTEVVRVSDVCDCLSENTIKQNQQTVAGTILSIDDVVGTFQCSNRAHNDTEKAKTG